MRYDNFRKALVDAVLESPGHTTRELRVAALHSGTVPAPIASYVHKVRRHAYKITDRDVAEIQQGKAGRSDDSLFEITVAAALGAALHRLDRGVAALRGEEPD